MRPLPVIFGCAGKELTGAERDFFRGANPVGFILFSRNIGEPAQVRALTDSLREVVGRDDAPILIDQEGGRVARLKPPHWRLTPPAARIGAVASRGGIEAACEAARLNAFLTALDLVELGVSVDCAPVVDVPVADAHDIIGDRAFSDDVVAVGRMAQAAARGLLEGGVLPVIKHIPGHGRARADSHAELPVVSTDRATLSRTDFAAFRAVADAPWAMTAHVLYTAIDKDRPATTSPTVIADIIRGEIGFDGVLVSDDLNMQALAGDIGDRAKRSLAAGCDLALHCTGTMPEMESVARATPAMTPAAARRIAAASALLKPEARPSQRGPALQKLTELLGVNS